VAATSHGRRSEIGGIDAREGILARDESAWRIAAVQKYTFDSIFNTLGILNGKEKAPR